MKTAPILLAAALAASAAPDKAPRDLAEPDRQAALDLLAEITGEIREARSGRHGGAAGTFHAAAASPETALEFWLKCVEKVDFEERNKDSQDFRASRRRPDRRLDVRRQGVERDFRGDHGVGRRHGGSGLSGAANRDREMGRPVPYAGTTRIRFEGFPAAGSQAPGATPKVFPW